MFKGYGLHCRLASRLLRHGRHHSNSQAHLHRSDISTVAVIDALYLDILILGVSHHCIKYIGPWMKYEPALFDKYQRLIAANSY
jgi:hypothetical protein